MKISSFLLLLLCVSFSNLPVQNLNLTKTQAEEALQQLQTHSVKRVLSWCGCCDNKNPQVMSLDTLFHSPCK